MKEPAVKIFERTASVCFYLSVLCIPMATGALAFFPYGDRVFLVLAALFCAASALFLLFSGRLWQQMIKLKFLLLFAAVITVLATVRYVICLCNGSATTFFAQYEIPMLILYAFFGASFCMEKPRGTETALSLFCTVCSILTLVFQNRFFLDLGVYRFTALYSNPNICASFSLYAGLFSVCLLAWGRGIKLLNLCNLSVAVAAVVWSYSRANLAGLAAALAVFALAMLLGRRKKFTREKAASAARVIAAVLVLSALCLVGFAADSTDKQNAMVVGSGQRHDDEINENYPEEFPPEESLPEGSAPEGEPSHPGEESQGGESSESSREEQEDVEDRFSLDSHAPDSILHNMRFRIWEAYCRKAPEFFWLGAGDRLGGRPIVDGAVRDTHNTLLYTLYRYGVFGLLAFLLLIGALLVRLLAGARHSGFRCALLGAFCGVGLGCLFGDMLNTGLFALALAVFSGCAYRPMETEKIPEPRRVLQLFSTINKGGAESRTMDLYRTVDREEIQFDFLVTTPGAREQFFYQEICSLGGKVLEVPPVSQVGVKKYCRLWRRSLLPYEVVHVHCSTQSGAALLFAWLNRVPVRIVHYRDSGTGEFQNASFFRKCYLQISRILSLCLSTRRLYCSTEAREYAAGPFWRLWGKFTFLPNAVRLSAFPVLNAEEKQRKRQELSVEGASFLAGTVGNSRPVKNHLFLVKVFEAFLQLEPGSRLLIVGNDAEDGEAKQYAAEHGLTKQILFLGVRSDINALLQILDVFLLPSLKEGAPGSVIEAQAANVPCLLSDTITRDVDVGAGLVKYIPLTESAEYWAREMQNACKMERPEPDTTREKLRESGYDVAASAERLLSLYF